MMIGVSKWKYSQSAIDKRQDACDYYIMETHQIIVKMKLGSSGSFLNN